MNKLRRIFLGVIAAVAVGMAASGSAWAIESPTHLDGATVVTADKVKELLAGGVPVVDTRTPQEHAEAHIKGALYVPYKEKSAKAENYDVSQDSFDLTKLPGDKAAPIVFYCNGHECWKSYKASKAAIKAGYKKVLWFRGGFPEWKAKGYPVE